MISEKIRNNAVMLKRNSHLEHSYEIKELFERENSPLSDGTRPILLVSAKDWAQIWNADFVEKFFKAFRQWGDQESSLKGFVLFQNQIKNISQTVGTPHSFLWRMEQLSPEKFPLMRVQGVELYANPSLLKSYEESEKRSEAPTSFEELPENKILAHLRRLKIKKWLRELPLSENEEVYIALAPSETLIVPWTLFVEHWHIFYHNRLCTLNAVDDDPRWFLFIHHESIAYFGCTEEYAREKNAPLNSFPLHGSERKGKDIYKDEQIKARKEFHNDLQAAIKINQREG